MLFPRQCLLHRRLRQWTPNVHMVDFYLPSLKAQEHTPMRLLTTSNWLSTKFILLKLKPHHRHRPLCGTHTLPNKCSNRTMKAPTTVIPTLDLIIITLGHPSSNNTGLVLGTYLKLRHDRCRINNLPQEIWGCSLVTYKGRRVFPFLCPSRILIPRPRLTSRHREPELTLLIRWISFHLLSQGCSRWAIRMWLVLDGMR